MVLAVIASSLAVPFDLAAAPSDLAAVQIEAHASISPSVVPLNGQFTLEVELRGTNRTDVEPSLPDLGSFSRYIGRNSSTSMQMINGATTVSLVIQYRYRAIREGTFEIGAVEVDVGGQVLRTQPVTLTVSRSGAAAVGGGAASEPSGVSRDDLFIVAEVGKARVYQERADRGELPTLHPREREFLQPRQSGRKRGVLGRGGPRSAESTGRAEGARGDSPTRPQCSGGSSSFPLGRAPRRSSR